MHSKKFFHMIFHTQVAPRVLLIGLAAFLLLPTIAVGQECNGQVTVRKTFDPPSVLAGDPVTVYVHVHGCSGEVDTPVPFDAVLVIDQSGSMNTNDQNDRRIDAAEDFVDCAPANSRIGIVSFDDNADLRAGMTTDTLALHNVLDNLRGNENGATNIYDALVQARTLLTGSTREKFIVLLTDGRDSSGHSETDFVALLDQAVAEEIRYITIALGNNTETWMLRYFAERTGGQFAESPTASQLAAAFNDACRFAGSLAKTRNIVLKERVNVDGGATPSAQPVAGSFDTDIASIDSSQIDDFYNGGSIDADIGTLGSGEGRFIKFDIASHCLNPDSQEDSVSVDIDNAASVVEYVFGVNSASAPVQMKQFTCLRPGGTRISKEFDASQLELRIKIESRYLPDPTGVVDNTLRGIEVVDQPSSHFQPQLNTLVPNTEVEVFPGFISDIVLWRLGDLAPQAEKIVSMKLRSRVCDDTYAPPIPVNATKSTGGWPLSAVTYLKPDGTAGVQKIPDKSTNLLPPIPNCPGRPDIYLEPAQTYAEYKSGLKFVQRYVDHRQDSLSIWVDAKEGNGYWDGTLVGLAAVAGAKEIPRTPGAEIVDRFDVDGQGDILPLNTPDLPRFYVRLANTGDRPFPGQPNGIRLYAYNHVTGIWNALVIDNMPAVDSQKRRLVRFEIPTNMISATEHIRPYKMKPLEALVALRQVNPTFVNQFIQWLTQNPSVVTQLRQMGPSEPNDMIALLPADIGVVIAGELQTLGYKFAWGKPSIQVRVVTGSSGGDAHTNNNSAEEVILVR